MVTYGLRPFIGRELELAPRPCDARTSFQVLNTISRKILDTGAMLSDGVTVRSDTNSTSFLVRDRKDWLRRDSSAYVLVAEDAVVDAQTLKAI